VHEDEIKSGLRGNELKQFEAVCKAYGRYAAPLASYIRERVAPTLDSHELTTAVNDVFIELAKKARHGNFRTDGSLACLLFEMARCNAFDQLREKYRYQKRYESTDFSGRGNDTLAFGELSDDEIASRVALKLAGAPEIAAAWRSVASDRTPDNEVAAIEIVRLFKMWIGTLPSLQRKVAERMAANFGDVTDEEIRDEIGKISQCPALGSVKSARREIREKFKSLIEEKERTKGP
jgi:DNA-directed RNA polymerase specialized sigma24 family protein